MNAIRQSLLDFEELSGGRQVEVRRFLNWALGGGGGNRRIHPEILAKCGKSLKAPYTGCAAPCVNMDGVCKDPEIEEKLEQMKRLEPEKRFATDEDVEIIKEMETLKVE